MCENVAQDSNPCDISEVEGESLKLGNEDHCMVVWFIGLCFQDKRL